MQASKMNLVTDTSSLLCFIPHLWQFAEEILSGPRMEGETPLGDLAKIFYTALKLQMWTIQQGPILLLKDMSQFKKMRLNRAEENTCFEHWSESKWFSAELVHT